jgi:four helix bundle protein
MEKVESFEDLWIWQEARGLVREIYTDFGEGSAAYRDYGFKGQIQNAGISIMNNIAEGFERTTDADKARFLDIAKGSAGEVRSMYYPAEDLGYVSSEVARNRREKVRTISKGIATLTTRFRPSTP